MEQWRWTTENAVSISNIPALSCLQHEMKTKQNFGIGGAYGPTRPSQRQRRFVRRTEFILIERVAGEPDLIIFRQQGVNAII